MPWENGTTQTTGSIQGRDDRWDQQEDTQMRCLEEFIEPFHPLACVSAQPGMNE